VLPASVSTREDELQILSAFEGVGGHAAPMIASHINYPSVVEALLMNGADPKLRDAVGKSPSDHACSDKMRELLSGSC
jgi:ankyrin repeat protein